MTRRFYKRSEFFQPPTPRAMYTLLASVLSHETELNMFHFAGRVITANTQRLHNNNNIDLSLKLLG